MYSFATVPISILRILKIDAVNVRPFLLLTRDSQPSGIRSSIRIDWRSSTRPPNIVRKNEALV